MTNANKSHKVEIMKYKVNYEVKQNKTKSYNYDIKRHQYPLISRNCKLITNICKFIFLIIYYHAT